jgi:hypothetical protein
MVNEYIRYRIAPQRRHAVVEAYEAAPVPLGGSR